MKKAKIMLSAIAVITILSGTLAFKAHQRNVQIPYAYCPAGAGQVCQTTTIWAASITTVQPANPWTLTFFGTTDAGVEGQSCVQGQLGQPCTTRVFQLTKFPE